MTPSVTAPTRRACPAVTLAEHVAALLPARAGSPWTVEPCSPWWTARYPGARLVQGERALVLVARTWDTEIGWQLPDREPTRPDVCLDHLAPAAIAREVLRLVLPVVDDEAARRLEDGARARRALLYEIGNAMRAQGVATYERAGLLVNTSGVTWSSSGCRYSATLHGTNPVADVQIQGPVRAVERAVAHFLPEAASGSRVVPAGIRGRLERRMAQVLARHGHVEQLEQKGLAFGSGSGPYGHVAPAFDPAARAHDTTPASVDLHAVGVDFLVSLAPHLAR
ncbi:hypothetical protein IM697_18540 [Streptomyces ferrugineus]|uniref:Uncharacterized protein n=1 Tax=Streptomyces ferrugineus TaxID=1413221 RepID=A0A7M2SY67_9ACTN|nr:hypothetical protein [Streptomyces ferrugineus]QOV40221.1 hypothetical protein IM697_18540 [Streptomyces ferrugineus]